MTNSKVNPSLKSRQTKLGKKTHDELVAIVLKKDNIERKLNAQITNLKAEVNSLERRIKNYNIDMAGTEETVNTLNDKIKTLQENNDALKMDNKDNYDLFVKESNLTAALTKTCKFYKTLFVIASIIAISAIATIAYFA